MFENILSFIFYYKCCLKEVGCFIFFWPLFLIMLRKWRWREYFRPYVGLCRFMFISWIVLCYLKMNKSHYYLSPLSCYFWIKCLTMKYLLEYFYFYLKFSIFYPQKLLAKMVRIYEKRINWLSVASRRIWGSVCERRYCIPTVLVLCTGDDFNLSTPALCVNEH